MEKHTEQRLRNGRKEGGGKRQESKGKRYCGIFSVLFDSVVEERLAKLNGVRVVICFFVRLTGGKTLEIVALPKSSLTQTSCPSLIANIDREESWFWPRREVVETFFPFSFFFLASVNDSSSLCFLKRKIEKRNQINLALSSNVIQ